MAWTVFVDDNFHAHDESHRYRLGEFEDAEAALAACRAIVDGFLRSKLTPDMTAEALWDGYRQYGEDPFIVGSPEVTFSAWAYAKAQCTTLCSPRP